MPALRFGKGLGKERDRHLEMLERKRKLRRYIQTLKEQEVTQRVLPFAKKQILCPLETN